MRRAYLIQTVAAVLLSWIAVGPALADTTVYLVRHAEKAVGGRDPDLNAAGIQRAGALANVLRSAGIDACFATQFRRTKHTVAPTAKAVGVEVDVAQAGKEKGLIEQIKSTRNGQQVLVAGHSNTVPLMLKELGVASPPKLSEKDYDDLFIVVIGDDGLVAYQHLHYGAANPRD